HTGAGIGKAELPVIAEILDAYGQSAALFHGTNRVLTKIPEDLLHAISIGQSQSFRSRIPAFDVDAELLHFEALLQQSERVLEQCHDVYLRETVLLGVRIGEEVGNDVVEALRLAGNNLEQATMLVVQAWDL